MNKEIEILNSGTIKEVTFKEVLFYAVEKVLKDKVEYIGLFKHDISGQLEAENYIKTLKGYKMPYYEPIYKLIEIVKTIEDEVIYKKFKENLKGFRGIL